MAKATEATFQEVQGPEKVYIATKRNFHATTLKHVGKRHGMEQDKDSAKNAKTYLSYPKNLQLFCTDTEIICFQEHVYRTDSIEQQKFLNGHPALNRDFWLEKFPERVERKFAEEKKWLTPYLEEFAPSEA